MSENRKSRIIVSIIIRGHNNRDFVLPLIESIKGNIHRHSYEIIYVDNGSNDGSPEVIKKVFGDIIILENDRNLGPCKACNIGLHRARGEILLILDSDTKILSNLDTIIDYMLVTPECSAATGRIMNPDGSHQPNVSIFPNLRHAFFISLMHMGLSLIVKNNKAVRDYYMLDFDMTKVCVVDKIALFCFFIKSSAYDIIGDQDEAMFMYFEDVDWCFRLKEKNLEIHYFPDLSVLHYGGQTTRKKSWGMHKIYQNSLKVFCRKHIYPKHNVVYNILIRALISLRYAFLYLARFFGIRFVGGAGYRRTAIEQKKTLQ